MSHLTEHELDHLLQECPPQLRSLLARLLNELRELREQQGAREFFESQEQVT